MYRRDDLPWRGDHLLDFGGTEIELCMPPDLYERQSKRGHFVLGKTRWMVEEMMRIIGDREVRSIVDLGVYKGGSVVLYNEIFQPWRLMAVDLNPTPPPSLVEYLESRNPPTGVRLKLGVNQANRLFLKSLVDRTFQNTALDLVVDDAAHLFFESRESFRALFPLLRAGGLYVIEDWAWAHWAGEFWQESRGGSFFSAQPPMSNLLIEIMLLSASCPGIVSKMVVNGTVAYVERGPDHIEGDFELSEHYLNRGDPVPLLGVAVAGSRDPQS